ncbi:MAG: hypothetical protein J7M25_06830 [Deltaproteobacteria bacterium]|nr:hypothetical protein [Deltaproteobacteria bacterium]
MPREHLRIFSFGTHAGNQRQKRTKGPNANTKLARKPGLIDRILGFAVVMMSLAFVSATALFWPGCGSGHDDGSRVGAVATTAPALKADGSGQDAADHDCRIILRSVTRLPGWGGFETQVVGDRPWWVWTAEVDVAADLVDQGAVPAMLYGLGATWWQSTEAVEETDAGHGAYRRFRIRFYENTISPASTSMTGLSHFEMDVIPALLMPDGGRIFDHNRLAGDFENDHLDEANWWSIKDDPNVCDDRPAPLSVIEFQPGYRQMQHAPVVAGGLLEIHENLARINDCVVPLHDSWWGLEANVRFLPGGQVATQQIHVAQRDSAGHILKMASVRFHVPGDATSVQVWFRSWNDQGCETWDSNYGENYSFGVLPHRLPEVTWAGNWGHSLIRDCQWNEGLDEPVSITSYMMERACMSVFADVYVPGVTDSNQVRPEMLAARVVYSIGSGQGQHQAWITFDSKQGNNYRFKWDLPREEMRHMVWSSYEYALEFSSDGVTWFRIAQGEGPDGGEPRTIKQAY